MPSQLRLRAIATDAAAARRATPPPGAPARNRREAAALVPTERTREVMRSIQVAIDEHQTSPDLVVPAGDHVVDGEESGALSSDRRTKRARPTLPSALPSPISRTAGLVGQPSNAVVGTRDGRTKIYIGGYEFTRSTITSVKISYRCSFYRSQACPAKLEFYASLMDYDFLNMVPHTCTPPSQRAPALDESSRTVVVKAAMQNEVDKLALSCADTPQAIWDKISSQFYNREDNVVVRGLSKAQVTRRVHRTRALHFGSDLHGRVEVPPLSRVKLTGLNFFQFHHVWSSPSVKNEYKIDRLIGWAHPSLLSLLRYGKISLFIDGTFRCVPRHFRQCVVVMVFDQGTKLYVPVFYVLAASKTFDAYWNLLQYVSDACGQRIEPEQVVCDFESALIKAVGDWFPDTDIVGCFFHFKQACSRKMKKLRIPKAEISIAMEKGVFDMLTVVDPAKIAKQGIAWVRVKIKERCEEDGVMYSSPKWASFWVYFRKTWLRLLPPKVWNVHGIRRDIVARTNNPLERFNREINAAFGTPHPSIVRFVQTIEEISRRYVKLRDDIARGIAAPPRRDMQPELPSAVALPDVADEDSDDSIGEVDGDDDGSSSDGNSSSGDDDDLENSSEADAERDDGIDEDVFI